METTGFNKKIVVTGATGLLGRRLCFELIRRGYEVVGLVRNPESFISLAPLSFKAFKWTCADDLPQQALEGSLAVVHLAGEPVGAHRWTEKQKQRIWESRVLGTRQLVQAMGTLPHSRPLLISASAIGIYGSSQDQLFVETSKPESPDFLAKVCRDWEAEALAYETSFGSALNILRLGLILAPEGGALQPLLSLFRKGLGGPVGHGQQWMSWVHILDAVRAIMHFIEGHQSQGLRGTFNIVSPHPVPNREFAVVLAKALHRPMLLPVPTFALKLAMGEMATLALSSQKVSSSKLQNQGFQFQFSDLPNAIKDILFSSSP